MRRLWHVTLEFVRRVVEYVATPVDQDVEFPEGVLNLDHFSRVHLLSRCRGSSKIQDEPRKGCQLMGLYIVAWKGRLARSSVEGRKAKQAGRRESTKRAWAFSLEHGRILARTEGMIFFTVKKYRDRIKGGP